MTGATGYIGTHVLRELLDRTGQDIYCLVRSGNAEEGKTKLIRRLTQMGLFRAEHAARLIPVPGDVSLPRFGLDDRTYAELADSIDAVIHGAAFVNFIYPYEALKKTNVGGMREIIRFACDTRTKPVHFVSSTGIWPMGTERVFTEETSIDHDVLLNLGYDESKWTQEKMLRQAQARGLPAVIYRPGEVSGHSETGRINADEHFAFALLKGCLQLEAFPPINCFIDLSPVDYVGRVIAHLSQQPGHIGGVFHITNPAPMHSTAVFAWFESRGYTFDVIPVTEWLARLIGSKDFTRNALYPYMALLEEFGEENFQLPRYQCQRTVEALDGSGIACPPVDGRLLGRYTDFLVGTGFLPAPRGVAGRAYEATR
jgi:thioester reductase-like protein